MISYTMSSTSTAQVQACFHFFHFNRSACVCVRVLVKLSTCSALFEATPLLASSRLFLFNVALYDSLII